MRSIRLPALLFLVAVSVAATASWALWRAVPEQNTAQQHFDVILVLGSPCMPDGSASPEQRERVLEGVHRWQRGDAPRLVMSGAAAHNHWIEAESMGRLARTQGVPAASLFEEPQALDTIGNVYYASKLMQAHGWHSAEVVSSWSHLPRAALILRHFDLQWRTTSAPWPREYGPLDRSKRDWREALYCLKLRLFGFVPTPMIHRWPPA